jgi:NAD(P)H-dependent flavin oxidoreductase YrpB (nitropropane dioxygenase family)
MVSELSATSARKSPWLIQGGMGIAISGWPLARAVAQLGQLGVVSGTAIDSVFARR